MTDDLSEQFIKIQKQLQEIQAAFEFIKRSGLDREILIAYLKERSHMGRGSIEKILDAQNEFFDSLGRLAVKPKP